MECTISKLEAFRGAMMQCIDYRGRKFSYALERNIEKVESRLKQSRTEMLQSPSFKKSQAFTDYYNALGVLRNEHFKRDEEGNVIVDQDNEPVMGNAAAFKKAERALKKKHSVGSAILEGRLECIKERECTKVEVTFYTLRFENELPEEITVSDRVRLREFMFEGELLVQEGDVV